MAEVKSYHSICASTFTAGRGGFTPDNLRPAWASNRLQMDALVELIMREIAPRLPAHVELGLEMHYDNEAKDFDADTTAAAMRHAGLYLAMLSPGAHQHFAYGGITSPDPEERSAAEAFIERAITLAYGPLRRVWHRNEDLAPALVIWNGSFGYDLASIGISDMYANLLGSLAKLCHLEELLGGQLYWALEPKPNDGHPAMLLPTAASALVAWWRLREHYGIGLERKGVCLTLSHSEMIGLDPVNEAVELLDCGMLTHMHLNSQGLNNGVVLGGPGKFSINHGVSINAATIVIAGLVEDAKYSRWKGHDLQPRPYDNKTQALDRIIRSVQSWEACAHAARQLDLALLREHLGTRQTGLAEDMLRQAVMTAQHKFNEMRS